MNTTPGKCCWQTRVSIQRSSLVSVTLWPQFHSCPPSLLVFITIQNIYHLHNKFAEICFEEWLGLFIHLLINKNLKGPTVYLSQCLFISLSFNTNSWRVTDTDIHIKQLYTTNNHFCFAFFIIIIFNFILFIFFLSSCVLTSRITKSWLTINNKMIILNFILIRLCVTWTKTMICEYGLLP